MDQRKIMETSCNQYEMFTGNVDSNIKVISGRPGNFNRCLLPHEYATDHRPMMLNAWTQTDTEDFSVLCQLNNSEGGCPREKELLERIRVLEQNLKEHLQILDQIHVTASRRDSLTLQNIYSSNYSTPMQMKGNNSINSNHSSVSSLKALSPRGCINALPRTDGNSKESVKYKIVSDSICISSVECPIEIQLAEDDGALLNASSDSGRLEICLNEESEDTKDFNTNEEQQIKSSPQQEFYQTESGGDVNYSQTQRTQGQKHSVKGSEAMVPIQKRQRESYEDTNTPVSSYNSCNRVKVLSSHNPAAPSNKIRKLTYNNAQEDTNKRAVTPKYKKNECSTIEASNTDGYDMKTPEFEFSTVVTDDDPGDSGTDNIMVSIGPNNTRVPAKLYENMNWNSPSIATRKLLVCLFGRDVLATHSMTGKPSPAFKSVNKPLKQMLDPSIIQDIIFVVTRKCNVSEKEVRNAITTKCSDENKMMKLQMSRKQRIFHDFNKENIYA